MDDRLCLLQEIAYRAGFRNDYANLHSQHPRLDGLTKFHEKLILIDTFIRDTPQELCVLAEEVEHILCSPNIDHRNYHSARYRDIYKTQWERDNIEILVAKDELVALETGTSLIISDQDFWDFAALGQVEWKDWLNHFGVEDWFMRYKAGFMQKKHWFRWKDLIRRTAG
jgi:hypothetical protein